MRKLPYPLNRSSPAVVLEWQVTSLYDNLAVHEKSGFWDPDSRGKLALYPPYRKCLVRSLEVFQDLIRKILHAFFFQDLVMKLARFLQDLASNLQDFSWQFKEQWPSAQERLNAHSKPSGWLSRGNYLSINAVFIQKVFSNLYVCNKPYSLKTYILKLQVRNHHCTTLQTE